MSAQNTYKYSTPLGQPGGIVDLAPYAIDSFVNESADGVMKFGMGVVKGTSAGTQVKVPAAASNVFEGVVVNRRTNENALTGGVQMKKGCTVGVMRYGRIYVCMAAGVSPNYGDSVYLLAGGDDAGCFTNTAATAEEVTAGKPTIAVKARFLGKASDGIAAVELFNQAQS